MLQTLVKIDYTGQMAQHICYKGKYSINGVISDLDIWALLVSLKMSSDEL